MAEIFWMLEAKKQTRIINYPDILINLKRYRCLKRGSPKRTALGDNSWGEAIKGIPGGRDIGQELVQKYYAKSKDKGTYNGCTSYEDFRELLEKEKDLNAIKIMTPDHLHATVAIASLKKGKHVVTHKPIANRMYEARLTIDTARKTGLSTYLLAWSRRPEYNTIKKWISEGKIGKLKEIHNWSNRPVWPQWQANPTDNPPVPKGFNWDLWLGPVPDRPYHPDYTHAVFRGWYDGGMKPTTPEELSAAGTLLEREGMMFIGDKGKIIGGFRGEKPVMYIENKMAITEEVTPEPAGQDTNDVWINAFKNNTQSPGSFLYAGPVTETILLGAVSLRAGKRVEYDSVNMKITSSPDADKYLFREYRKGWEL